MLNNLDSGVTKLTFFGVVVASCVHLYSNITSRQGVVYAHRLQLIFINGSLKLCAVSDQVEDVRCFFLCRSHCVNYFTGLQVAIEITIYSSVNEETGFFFRKIAGLSAFEKLREIWLVGREETFRKVLI